MKTIRYTKIGSRYESVIVASHVIRFEKFVLDDETVTRMFLSTSEQIDIEESINTMEARLQD